MVEILIIGIAAQAGVILSAVFFFSAGILYFVSSKTGIARLLNTQENMLTILIEISELLFLMTVFLILFEISGNATMRLLSHVALYSASLLFLVSTFLDYRERKAQAEKDMLEIEHRRTRRARAPQRAKGPRRAK